MSVISKIAKAIEYLGVSIKWCAVASAFYSLIITLCIAGLCGGSAFVLQNLLKLYGLVFSRVFWEIMPLSVAVFLISLFAGRALHAWNFDMEEYGRLQRYAFVAFLLIEPVVGMIMYMLW